MKKGKIETLLCKSFDGTITAAEKELLQNALQNSTDLRRKFNEIAHIRETLRNSAEPEFSPSFEHNILRKTGFRPAAPEEYPILSDALSILFKRVSAAALLIMCILISYNIVNDNSYSIQSLLGNYSTPVEYAFDSAFDIIRSGI